MQRWIGLAAMLAVAGSILSPAIAQRAAPSSIAPGRQLYVSQGCAECHGYSGQGTVGSRLAPNLIPRDLFGRQLRNPRGVMPIYTAKVLSDADVADLYAYLSSIPAPPPVAKIPLLN